MPRTPTAPALEYSVTGHGPVVVLAHALGCHRGMWDHLAAVLSATHTVVAYDARCHGSSEVVTEAFSLDDLVADARRLIDLLGAGTVSWVGASMGGMVGQGLAIADAGRVRALVLANTTSRYGPDARAQWAWRAQTARSSGMTALADLVMERYFSPAFRAARADVVARVRRDLLAIDPQAYAACCEALAMLDYSTALSRIACPTLVVAGTLDVATPIAASEEIVRAIPGAHLATLPAGHLAPLECPAELAHLVSTFLARL